MCLLITSFMFAFQHRYLPKSNLFLCYHRPVELDVAGPLTVIPSKRSSPVIKRVSVLSRSKSWWMLRPVLPDYTQARSLAYLCQSTCPVHRYLGRRNEIMGIRVSERGICCCSHSKTRIEGIRIEVAWKASSLFIWQHHWSNDRWIDD